MNATATKSKKATRNASIVDQRESGLAFAKIGKRYGISKQRAHQIFRALRSR